MTTLTPVGHGSTTQQNDPSPTVTEERVEAGKSVFEKVSKVEHATLGRDKPPLYDFIIFCAGQDWNSLILGRPTADDGEPSVRLFDQS